jgi:hypothetical protein
LAAPKRPTAICCVQAGKAERSPIAAKLFQDSKVRATQDVRASTNRLVVLICEENAKAASYAEGTSWKNPVNGKGRSNSQEVESFGIGLIALGVYCYDKFALPCQQDFVLSTHSYD